MKLVMTMLIKNEADIIGQNLDFHAAMGVDHFIIMDHGSSDATLDLIAARDQGQISLYHQPDPGYYQAKWVTMMAQQAAAQHKADWVINNDADEFWWPTKGTLKDVFAAVPETIGGLYVHRFNFPPLREVALLPFQETMTYRDLFSVNSLDQPLRGKFCHRGYQDVRVAQGNHDAEIPLIMEKQASAGLEIFHFPMRSLRQFTNKIIAGGLAYQRSPALDPGIGRTWRQLYASLDSGGIEDFYQQSCLDPMLLDQPASPSRWQQDLRLRDVLRRLASRN